MSRIVGMSYEEHQERRAILTLILMLRSLRLKSVKLNFPVFAYLRKRGRVA